jgi:hypothetical protein
MLAIYQWIMGHEALMAGAAVGILDFLFAISPGIESNGILHWIWTTAKSIVGK